MPAEHPGPRATSKLPAQSTKVPESSTSTQSLKAREMLQGVIQSSSLSYLMLSNPGSSRSFTILFQATMTPPAVCLYPMNQTRVEGITVDTYVCYLSIIVSKEECYVQGLRPYNISRKGRYLTLVLPVPIITRRKIQGSIIEVRTTRMQWNEEPSSYKRKILVITNLTFMTTQRKPYN